MPLDAQINSLATRIGQEIKALRTAPKSFVWSIFFGDKLTASETLAVLTPGKAITIPASMAGSTAAAENAATAATVLSLRKNNVEFATVTFAAAGTTGTFSASALTTFAATDKLKIVASATADATLANVSVTIVGTA